MVAANRGHTEMVYLLLKEGNADTTLTDSYGKKAIDRANSSHISYLIATASIENRMKDVSTTLNQNEYSPERKNRSRSRTANNDQEGGANVEGTGFDRTMSSNIKKQFTRSILNSQKKRSTYSPQRTISDPRLSVIQDALYDSLRDSLL